MAVKTIPTPANWMDYKPRPDLEGKVLGVFAHTFTKEGKQEAIKRVYNSIVDLAIEEPTCVGLSANTSLVNPTHSLLYEEWDSYEEFFTVQVGRAYRHGCQRWIDQVREGMILPEFTEVLHATGPMPCEVAHKAYTLVQSVHVEKDRDEEAWKAFVAYVDDVGQDMKVHVAKLHRSLNNPQHFLLYEVWADFAYLVEHELHGERRASLNARCNELSDEQSPGPAAELFQIYYDPKRYSAPADWD